MNFESAARGRMKKSLREFRDSILEEFKRFTPGYNDQHLPSGPGEGSSHEHKQYGSIEGGGYLKDLVNSWDFVDNPAGRNSVVAIVNKHPAAGKVEFGWISDSGTHVHEGGHRMIASALKAGRVTAMYAETAHKVLIATLADQDWGERGKAGGGPISVKAIGQAAKTGALTMSATKYKVRVTGVAGRSTDTINLLRLTNKIADALVNMLNTGAIKYNKGSNRYK